MTRRNVNVSMVQSNKNTIFSSFCNFKTDVLVISLSLSFLSLTIPFDLCICCSAQGHSNAAIHFSKTAFIQLLLAYTIHYTLYKRHTKRCHIQRMPLAYICSLKFQNWKAPSSFGPFPFQGFKNCHYAFKSNSKVFCVSTHLILASDCVCIVAKNRTTHENNAIICPKERM